MTRFPLAAHLVSWAKVCRRPTSRLARARPKAATRATHGWLAPWAASYPRTGALRSFLGARYRRRGKQKAIVATGNSVLTVIYHLLLDSDATFCDLGAGYYESRVNKHRRARDLATQLQALTGQHIVIRDGKAVITEAAA
jgi:hypothetical protein